MINIVSKSTPDIDPPEEASLEEIQVPENNKISINYVHTREILYRNKIVINDVFEFKVAFGITRSDDEIEPQTVEECRHKNDWPIWKKAIQTELNSLAKHKYLDL